MTLEEAGAVTAPLAAERTEVAGRKESGPPSWDGRLPQRSCHGMAVKFLGLRGGTLLAGPRVQRPGTLSAWAARGAGAALPARASTGLLGGRGPGPLPLGAGKGWMRSRTVRAGLLSGGSHGGPGPKQAEGAAFGRRRCSTDLGFGDERREMPGHVG